MINQAYQFATPINWPFAINLGSPNGYAFLNLPGRRAISWNVEPEREERIVWQCGRLILTRPETIDEETDRLYDESEAAWEAYCSDFYSF